MTKYDEYCYNLMENAIKQGSERHGLPQEECVALMNIMLGVRGVENYIKEAEAAEDQRQMEKTEEYEEAFKKMPGIEVDESVQTHAIAVNATELAKKMAENSASGMTAEEYEKAIAKAPIEEVELAADLFGVTAEDKEIKEALKAAAERTQVIPAADCAMAANKLGKKLADFKKEREDDINGETMGD